ncbi:MAG: methylated-DNA--[protein]-cysteine S-methyltransferase [Clostridiales bacterium]|nr:methylated-DNA--[protein]-cysteine S-methyltransferase [Clostridiales bacterium]
MLTNVVAGIITKEEKVYIFKRRDKSYNGLYEFPGGKVENNESFSQALKRELYEELAIKTGDTTHVLTSKNEKIFLHVFIVNDYEGSITLLEHNNLKLVNQDEIYNYPLIKIDKKVITLCFKDEYLIMDTPFGNLKITGNCINITSITFTDEPLKITTNFQLLEARKQLNEYFIKKRSIFKLPLFIRGTIFQRKIWDETLKIAYGHTKTYGELASGAQAVGNALGSNKFVIVIPCHRVVAKNNIGGYNGGVKRKIKLLELESSYIHP